MSLRVACVGAGYFSQFHYDSWARLDGVALVGACDSDIGKARATGLPAYDSLAHLIDEQRPDLVDVILPPAAQADTLRAAMDAGVRHLICQKPFCTSLHEARTIAAEAETAGVTLVIHENFRFQPWYRAMKTVLDSGRLGDVQQVTFRLRPGDGQGPRAYLDRQPYFQQMPRFLVHETAVHWIDTFRYLLGDPLAVYADLRRINPVIAGEDAGYILFDFPGGARGLFDGNRSLDHPADNLRRTMGEALVEGTRGTLTLGGDGALHRRAFGDMTTTEILAACTWNGFGGDCVHHLQAHVVSALLEGTALENRAQDYLRVLEIEEAIYRSADLGQKVRLAED